jgi:hypothetical protein
MYIALLVVALFIVTVLFGAPYVPTLRADIPKVIELFDLRPGQTLLELGAGDGSLMVAAARQGIRVVGYEVNPILFVVAWWRLRPYPQAQIKLANYKQATWPQTVNGIYLFGSRREVNFLMKRIETIKPVRVVTYGFALPDLKPSAQDRAIIRYDIA